MKPSLLRVLRSPVDGTPLRLDGREPEPETEIEEGELVDSSGTRFPIVSGVPFFAEAESHDETFNFKWRTIGDTYGHEDVSRATRQQWYLDRFGYGDRATLHRALADRSLILDAGTGSGVDSAMFAESGRTVVSADLSREAALAAYRQLGALPNVNVIQADLRRLPFAAGTFDYVSSDQVIHHTPNTRESFDALARLVAPGGAMAVYVYRRKGPLREFADDFIRSHTTAMSVEECFEFSKQMTVLGKALTEVRATIDVPSIPLLELEEGEMDVQRFVYWHAFKCFWNDDYDFTTNAMVNFDWYHPKYAWRHDPDEVSAWYAENGLALSRLDVVPSGISALGARPAG